MGSVNDITRARVEGLMFRDGHGYDEAVANVDYYIKQITGNKPTPTGSRLVLRHIRAICGIKRRYTKPYRTIADARKYKTTKTR